MRVAYHAAVQKDVNRALRRYDRLSSRLGDEFWDELMIRIKVAAANPMRFHPYLKDLRRANLKRFPYHFLIGSSRIGFGSPLSAITNKARNSPFSADDPSFSLIQFRLRVLLFHFSAL